MGAITLMALVTMPVGAYTFIDIGTGGGGGGSTSGAITSLQLASYWSPIFYQQLNEDDDYDNIGWEADYLTKVDYDGDWKTTNNWENLASKKDSLNAYVYYWHKQTVTHDFLGYAVYHPRDWEDANVYFQNQHENDMEGVFLVIERITNSYGKLILMETMAHLDMHLYTDYQNTASSFWLKSSLDTIEGNVYDSGLGLHHPVVFIEAKNHGMFGVQSYECNLFTFSFSYNRPYVRYYNDNLNVADKPAFSVTPSDTVAANDDCSYNLIDINVLWNKRGDSNVFSSITGMFVDDQIGMDSHVDNIMVVAPPWLWTTSAWWDSIGFLWNSPAKYVDLQVNFPDSYNFYK
jgi:hypothetical protein